MRILLITIFLIASINRIYANEQIYLDCNGENKIIDKSYGKTTLQSRRIIAYDPIRDEFSSRDLKLKTYSKTDTSINSYMMDYNSNARIIIMSINRVNLNYDITLYKVVNSFGLVFSFDEKRLTHDIFSAEDGICTILKKKF